VVRIGGLAPHFPHFVSPKPREGKRTRGKGRVEKAKRNGRKKEKGSKHSSKSSSQGFTSIPK